MQKFHPELFSREPLILATTTRTPMHGLGRTQTDTVCHHFLNKGQNSKLPNSRDNRHRRRLKSQDVRQ